MERLLSAFTKLSWQKALLLVLFIGLLAFVMLYRLGSLVGGINLVEAQTAVNPVGLHGIYHQPLYLPLNIIRSIVFDLVSTHGQTLTRLPNALLGYLTVIEFILLIRLWHNRNTVLLSGILFASSAWVLHISRYASFDVVYLWLATTLLLVNAFLTHYPELKSAWFVSLIAICFCLYVPGAIWLIIASLYFTNIITLRKTWQNLDRLWQKALSTLIILLAAVQLIIDLLRPGQFRLWLGAPAHFLGLKELLKHFLAVPFHLLIKGPLYPGIWLGRSPIFDIFTLACSLIGIYFYITHLNSKRSRMLCTMFIISWVLISLGGPVGLSTLVPIMYAFVAMGLGYLLHEWLKVFPVNPVARMAGVSLLALLVLFAASYNLRSYFIVWPHDKATVSTFQYHR